MTAPNGAPAICRIMHSETRPAASYGVSRTPIREALVRFREHYTDILPSRGFMLHKPDEEGLGVARRKDFGGWICSFTTASSPT